MISTKSGLHPKKKAIPVRHFNRYQLEESKCYGQVDLSIAESSNPSLTRKKKRFKQAMLMIDLKNPLDSLSQQSGDSSVFHHRVVHPRLQNQSQDRSLQYVDDSPEVDSPEEDRSNSQSEENNSPNK